MEMVLAVYDSAEMKKHTPEEFYDSTTVLCQKSYEVGVFADDHCARLACRHENLVVSGIPQLKIANGSASNRKGESEPEGKRRRKLGVEPEVHAARIG